MDQVQPLFNQESATRGPSKPKIDGGNIRQSHQAIWSMAYITHNFCCMKVRRVKVQAFRFQISSKEWAFTLRGTSIFIVALLWKYVNKKNI